MTERLYYEDSYTREFEATVLSCEKYGAVWAAALNRTAFFPGGGGQEPDTGLIGGVRATGAFEKDGLIYHIMDGPLEAGGAVTGRIDWETRFSRMQNHSGEHVVSGTVHRLFGYDNVGFHMNGFDVTIDFNGDITPDQLRQVEALANEAVWKNLEIKALYPTPEALESLEYRSKLDLTENLRIVEVFGVDRCACCAPHLNRTGEIGQIRLLSLMRHRGGVRIAMVCGAGALKDAVEKSASVAAISAALSAPQGEVASAVLKLKDDLAEARYALAKAKTAQALKALEGLAYTEGNLCFFEEGLDMEALRAVVNKALPLCGGVCAAFSPANGGLQYVMGSRSADLKASSGEINRAIKGKGGGGPGMIQGSAAASEEEIRAYFGGMI